MAQNKGTEVERAEQQQSAQQRQVEGQTRAETAAGIGETDGQEHETAERDADGRRLWERPNRPQNSQAGPTEPPAEPPRQKDLDGKSGSQLDLSG
jgi:hypothetical protein